MLIKLNHANPAPNHVQTAKWIIQSPQLLKFASLAAVDSMLPIKLVSPSPLAQLANSLLCKMLVLLTSSVSVLNAPTPASNVPQMISQTPSLT